MFGKKIEQMPIREESENEIEEQELTPEQKGTIEKSLLERIDSRATEIIFSMGGLTEVLNALRGEESKQEESKDSAKKETDEALIFTLLGKIRSKSKDIAISLGVLSFIAGIYLKQQKLPELKIAEAAKFYRVSPDELKKAPHGSIRLMVEDYEIHLENEQKVLLEELDAKRGITVELPKIQEIGEKGVEITTTVTGVKNGLLYGFHGVDFILPPDLTKDTLDESTGAVIGARNIRCIIKINGASYLGYLRSYNERMFPRDEDYDSNLRWQTLFVPNLSEENFAEFKGKKVKITLLNWQTKNLEANTLGEE